MTLGGPCHLCLALAGLTRQPECSSVVVLCLCEMLIHIGSNSLAYTPAALQWVARKEIWVLDSGLAAVRLSRLLLSCPQGRDGFRLQVVQ